MDYETLKKTMTNGIEGAEMWRAILCIISCYEAKGKPGESFLSHIEKILKNNTI